MDNEKVQQHANDQREEAKRILNRLFSMGDNTTSPEVDRAVDCIISASILESVLLFSQGAKEIKNKTT